jgi:acetyl-CoA synthetase
MAVQRIQKSAPRLHPNLPDWDSTYHSFKWPEARALIDGLPTGGINIAYEAVDRHVAHGRGDHVAIRWLGKTGEPVDISYAELARRSNRFANVLRNLGLQPGDKVFCLSGRIPELYVAALGTFKAQCVFAPLFSAFGPEPIAQRMRLGGANLLLTTQTLLKRKVAGVLGQFPGLKVLLTDGEAEGAISLAAEMERASDQYTIAPTDPETLALLHFTSGTTGTPKGAMHVHEAVVAHNYSGRVALDLHPQDIYWCTADPGWVTGTSYGIIAPLCNGVTSIVDESEFDATRWYEILEREKVSVWYTAPTAIRRLMKLGAEPVKAHDLSALRYMASVGEPLNPEAVRWGNEVFGMPFHDNWWQTETGAIMLSNYASMDVKPGSMGRPLPGIEAAIVQVEGDSAKVIEQPGVQGELAIRRGWPSMFRGYLGADERYRKCFKGDWYVSGDLAKRDDEGYFWFVGRSDDVIKSAGHLIGPFEVESALVEHPAVNEAGVIGIPEETAGEIVKAFVALKPGFAPSDELKLEIMAHARKQLGPAVAPREIEFRDELPRTKSGKIMRRLLKARELGLPEGDLSTLEKSE